MTRYVSRPRAWWDEGEWSWRDDRERPTIVVIDTDDHRPTGILDKNGHMICRVRDQIGFRGRRS